jgi:hypothetical protein
MFTGDLYETEPSDRRRHEIRAGFDHRFGLVPSSIESLGRGQFLSLMFSISLSSHYKPSGF